MSIAVKEYTPKTHEMHSWQLELDMIESQVIDEGNTVTKLQTFIDQPDEDSRSATGSSNSQPKGPPPNDSR